MKSSASDKFETIVDFQGKHIRLYEHTVNHIRMRHPEIKDPREFVKMILEHPILVTEDELPDTVIYHRAIKKPILHVAYVQVKKLLVKSAHISDEVKGGKVIWFTETKNLIK